MLRNLKVSAKFLLMLVLVSIVPILALSIISYQFGRAALEREVYLRNSVFFKEVSSQLQRFFEGRKGDAQILSNQVRQILKRVEESVVEQTSESEESEEHSQARERDSLTQQQRAELESLLSVAIKSYGYDDIHITNERGLTIFATVDKRSEGVDRTDRVYIQKSLRGEANWSDLIYSNVYKTHVAPYSFPIYDDGKLIATLNLVVSVGTIERILHDALELVGKTANAYLITSDGTLLTKAKFGKYASPEAVLREKVNTHAQKILSDKIATGAKDFLSFGVYKDYRGVSVVGTFGVVRFGDKFAGMIVEQDEAEAFEGVYRLRNLSLALGSIVIGIGVIIGLFFSRSISKPLLLALETTKKIASGDLTETLSKELLSRKDEIGELLRSIEQMQLSLRSIVSAITESSRSVSASANSLADSSGRMNDSTKRMVAQVEDVDKATQNASASVEEVTSGVEEVSASAQTVAKASQDLSDKARRVELSAKEGAGAVNDIAEIILQTREKSARTDAVVRELSEKARNIGEIVQTINSIAEQTNLLALNAAIEAARAGEAGRGFAVVADEIRKLAEESKLATSKIESMLSEIQHGAETASSATSETAKVVERAYEQSDVVKKKFEAILRQVEEITGQIESLAASAEEQSAAAQEMSSAMDTVSRSITLIAHQIGDVTRGAKEMSEESGKVSSASSRLTEIAKQLLSQIEKFRV